jgi:hypothetical protein
MLALAVPVPGFCLNATAPYPAALESAAIKQRGIGSMTQNGLLLGNGEMNAVVYTDDHGFHIRIAKNDCWDLRVDTKHDHEMPVVDVAAGKAGGHGSEGSWKAPYPNALPCGEIVLNTETKSAVTAATLDLAKAAASVTTSTEQMEFRILAQSNVILIRSSLPLSLLGIRQFMPANDKNIDQWVSPSDKGVKDGYSYLHQNIPGDEDVSGMDIYLVAGRKDGFQAVAVTTTRDSKNPLQDAIKLVNETLASPDAAVLTHEAVWQEFWSKSGIQLSDATLQNWWYRMLYFNRLFARSNGNAVGLAANFNVLANWHNSLKLNYNIQQTYLAATPANHPEMVEPFIDVLTRALPRGRWFAQTSFIGSEGAFFNSDFWPFEPDPANCKTPYKHQQTYMPYGYSWGMAGQTMVVIWEYYSYAPSMKNLDRIYPLIKAFGTFYCSILEKCALVNGKRKMGPSYFPELGGCNEFNVCYDIHFVTAGMRIAREAAKLKNDTKFLERISALIDQLPGYTGVPDPEQGGQNVIERWSGAPENSGTDRHGTTLQGIFPAGVINWFSSGELKEMAKRTINQVERTTNHANSNVTINIARARLGLGAEAIENAKMCFAPGKGYSQELACGIFAWKEHGCFMTEQVCIARLVTELLLQSVGGIIRIFPALPASIDGRFSGLLAEGGFEVSAEQDGGVIGNVKIHSTVGGTAQLIAPWNGGFTVTKQGGNSNVQVNREQLKGVVSFTTKAGETYLLKPVP